MDTQQTLARKIYEYSFFYKVLLISFKLCFDFQKIIIHNPSPFFSPAQADVGLEV